MDYSSKVNEYKKKIYYSRLRMLTNHPFFGLFALDMKYSINEKEKTFSTNGYAITFNPNFLEMLSEEEVDICILHCILHTILKHPFKEKKYENKAMYNLACDIVVNSNILFSIDKIGQKELKILGQKLPHLAPDGKEGYLYSSDDIYYMLLKSRTKKPKFSKTPVLSVKTGYDGLIYGKLFSYSTYSPTGKWSDFVLLDKTLTVSPMLYSYKKYTSLYKTNYKAVIKNLSEMPILPTISYSDTYNLSQYDGIASKTKSKQETQKFAYQKYDIEDIELLQKIRFSQVEITAEELIYRDFVRKHYLHVDDHLKKYFESFCKINNFNKDDKDVIKKIVKHFTRHYKYNLSYLPVSNGSDYIIQFLEDTKEGLCQHFASAATMLFRYLDIPARYTIGYLIKAKKDNEVFVSDEDLHAWVEVYFDNVGWVVVEATVQQGSQSDNGQDGADSEDGDDDNDDGKDSSKGKKGKNDEDGYGKGSIDSHSAWEENEGKDEANGDREKDINNKMMQANNIASGRNCGKVPAFVSIAIDELTNPQIDWRVYLNSFIQENIVDYSFAPPDKRFSDSDFILPSFSEPDEVIQNILFMVDVSGSMSKKDIISCFSEIQAAITQFNGKIRGYIGFFDAYVKDVYEFDGDTKINDLKIYGGGGTDFHAVFKYVKYKMSDNLPSSIIILTDGYADFPNIKESMSIPVLWVINNKIIDPPWGSVTRIKSSK